MASVTNNVIVNGSGDAITLTSVVSVLIRGNTLYNNVGNTAAIFINTDTVTHIESNIVIGTGAKPGIAATAAGTIVGRYNAFRSNSVDYLLVDSGLGDVSLSADPFTNAAVGDFSLNSTAGGGAACKAAGYPGTFPNGTTVGFLDIGAVQNNGGGGGGSTPSNYGFVS
jgi:hypothetical protein